MKSVNYGGTIPVQSCKACVVYDSGSGRIHHTHHHIVLKGGRELSQDEIAAAALDLLRNRGVDVAQLKVLHTTPESIEAGTAYAVDVAKGALIAKARVARH